MWRKEHGILFYLLRRATHSVNYRPTTNFRKFAEKQRKRHARGALA